MKTWLKVTLAVILALVVLAGAGAAGYRLGLSQNPEVLKQLAELRAQRYSQMQKVTPPQALSQQGQNNDAPKQFVNPRGQGFDPHSRFDRRPDFWSGMFFFPLLGLIKWAALGALVWFGYRYVKNSGWKLVREGQPAQTGVTSAPAEEQNQNGA